MTFGSSSAMFSQFLKQTLGSAQTADNVLPSGYTGLKGNTLKAALYNDTPTPNKDSTAANTAYNAGEWVASGREVTDSTNWDAAGEPLTGNAITAPGSGVVMFDATDTPQSGASCTLASVYGCLVYDDTVAAGTGGVADLGVSFHSFGGAQSVTAGSFTIVWHANGLFRITV